MSQDQRYNRRQSSQDDPYERGFGHKLYEEDIGPEPTYSGGDGYGGYRGASRQQPPQDDSSGTSFFGFIFRFILIIGILVAVGFVALQIFLKPPVASEDGHLTDSATILIAGTDESGINTDTLMLLNIDRGEKQLSLMSIPRDTKVNSSYYPHKINGAYAANGSGEKGMFWLCDYVRQCVGFQPDGYILVDLDCFIELVDLFGGVEFYVPMNMDYEDPAQDLYIHLREGLQTLDGNNAMGVVRFRKGYDMQDLQRVNVQRDFIMAALTQWKSLSNIPKAPKALSILDEYCLTDLSTSNLLWMAESLLICGTDDMMMTTIPHTLGTEYVYIRGDEAYLELLNKYFNPYENPIGFDDLQLAD